MLENVSKKDLEKRLVESNVQLIESGNNSTLYRDDENHRLVTVSYDQNSYNPYFEWSRLWNISNSYRDVYAFDNVTDIIQELTDIAGANDDYLYDHLYDKPFSQTQKYIEKLGYIVVPLDFGYYGCDYNATIDESDPTLENVRIIAYVSKDELRKEYNSKLVTNKVKQNAFNFLSGSLESYNNYINGNVYSLSVIDTFENEYTDALCDIYLTDNFEDQVRDIYEYLQDMVNNVTIDFDDFKAQMKEYDQNDHKKVYLPF